ncbi:hypothetical protein ACEQPO_02195 [Bacillus sp. SL00103]
MKQSNYLAIHQEDTVMSLSNYVFDALCVRCVLCFIKRAKLIVLPKDHILNMNELSERLRREKSYFNDHDSSFHLLIDMKRQPNNIRKFWLGEERASVPHVMTALETVGEGTLVHMYGP